MYAFHIQERKDAAQLRKQETFILRSLLIIRDSLRKIYANYNIFLRPVLKFVLAFLMLFLLQGKIGYSPMLGRGVVIGASALLCAFFPFGFITFICGLFVLGNMFEVSYPMTLFALIVLMMIFVLYYGFHPGTGIIMALVPLAFFFKIPYLVPLILGMSAGIASSVPAVLGVLIWFILKYFSQHAELMLDAGRSADIVESFIGISESVLKNEYMYVIMLAFVLCIVTVSIISHSSMDHAWTIAVTAGTIVLAVVIFIGGAQYDNGAIGGELVGLVISSLLAFFYEYIFYCVDYKGTEHLRFEDDDYYYFVKAVPKVNPYDEDERRE